MKLLQTPIGRLRLVACLEAISFILLLAIAMPLKYWAGIESAVKVTGMAHGVLFLLFCVALFFAMRAARWPIWKASVVFIAALVPFGPFLIDGRLKQDDAH